MGAFDALRHALLAFLAARHDPALFLVLLVEEAGVPLPLPGNALVMFEGVRVRSGQANAVPILALVWLAVTLGSFVPYWLGRRFGQAAVLRFGRYIRLYPERIDRMAWHYRRRGPWAIVIGRVVPWVRVPTCLMAGIFGVPLRVYAPCTAFAAALWTLLYFLGGLVLERPVRRALAFFQRDADAAVAAAVLTALLLVGAALLVRRLLQARAHRAVVQAQGSD